MGTELKPRIAATDASEGLPEIQISQWIHTDSNHCGGVWGKKNFVTEEYLLISR